MFHQINHGKLGITLNAKEPRAVELLKRLAARKRRRRREHVAGRDGARGPGLRSAARGESAHRLRLHGGGRAVRPARADAHVCAGDVELRRTGGAGRLSSRSADREPELRDRRSQRVRARRWSRCSPRCCTRAARAAARTSTCRRSRRCSPRSVRTCSKRAGRRARSRRRSATRIPTWRRTASIRRGAAIRGSPSPCEDDRRVVVARDARRRANTRASRPPRDASRTVTSSMPRLRAWTAQFERDDLVATLRAAGIAVFAGADDRTSNGTTRITRHAT